MSALPRLLPHPLRRALLLAAAGTAAVMGVAAPAHAQRPQSVETAVVGPRNSAYVESWYARAPGKQDTWTIAPAWVPIDTLQIGGLVARNTTSDITSSALQLKWSMTPAQRDGCQLGSVLGVRRAQRDGPDVGYYNAIMSCNDPNGAMHLNLGRVRPSGGPSATTWGISFEVPDGSYTGFAEAFGQRGTDETHETRTYQLGLRATLSPRWQVDGTVGRVQELRESGTTRETVYSIGLKRSF